MSNIKERAKKAYKATIKDLERLIWARKEGREDEELGPWYEYGLCFDYVPPYTFKDQREGYFRYQLSYGGPSDEFRFFVARINDPFPERIEYWFLDWFEGECIEVTNKEYDLLSEIWQYFQEIGTVEAEFKKAMGF